MITIAIDCGASFIKGARFENNICIAQIEEIAPNVNDPLNLNIGMTHIENIVEIVKRIINSLARDDKELYLAVSNEMHGFLLTDTNGNLITDYISWQHEYGHENINGVSSYELLKNNDSLKNDIFHSGMKLRGGLPSVNLYYLFRKGYLNNSAKMNFYTLGDYLLYALSGKSVPCHVTNAAATGLFDMINGIWNLNLIKFVSEERICMPKISNEEIVFCLDGKIIHALPAIGDQQAALLGAGVEYSDILSFNIGTGAQVSVLTETLELSSEYQIRPYFGSYYLKTIPHIPAGRAMNVYIRFLKDILMNFGIQKDDYEIWQVILEKSNQSNNVSMTCDMSFFDNAITKKTKGSINSIGEYELNLVNLFSSIFKSMADNFVFMAEKITKSKTAFNKVIFSGGLAKKVVRLREEIAKNYSDKTITISEHDTLYGLMKYVRQHS